LYLPNTEITLDLKVNEVEVKVLTSLASVVGITERERERELSVKLNSIDRIGYNPVSTVGNSAVEEVDLSII
jgi:hypothetical protein